MRKGTPFSDSYSKFQTRKTNSILWGIKKVQEYSLIGSNGQIDSYKLKWKYLKYVNSLPNFVVIYLHQNSAESEIR